MCLVVEYGYSDTRDRVSCGITWNADLRFLLVFLVHCTNTLNFQNARKKMTNVIFEKHRLQGYCRVSCLLTFKGLGVPV